jgi:ATP-dependent DNA helicase RecG
MFPELEHWLRQRELISRRDNAWHPNAVAILLFGLSPQSHLPGASVEIVQYRGDDFDSEVVGRKTVTGTVPDQLDTIWQDMAGRIVDTPLADEGIKTRYGPQYPVNALRELARNMLQHRLYEGTSAPARISWFADRVVFNNPGGPYGQASQGELGEHSDYRNPTLTRELAGLGYVERLGRGLVLARRALEKNGNPPMKVETDGFTTITFWARKSIEGLMTNGPQGRPRSGLSRETGGVRHEVAGLVQSEERRGQDHPHLQHCPHGRAPRVGHGVGRL